jgi:hypothetical protein
VKVPGLVLLLQNATLDATDDGQRLSSFTVLRSCHGLGGSLSLWAATTTSYGPTSQRLGLGVREVELSNAFPRVSKSDPYRIHGLADPLTSE